MAFPAQSQSAFATHNVSIADSTASTANDEDEVMADAPPLDALAAHELKGGEAAVDESPPCNALGGDAITARSAVGDGHAAPDPAAASAIDAPATQGAVERSSVCNLPRSNAIACRTASFASIAAATRPVIPVYGMLARDQIIRVESQLREERLKSKNSEMMLKDEEEYSDRLQKQLKEAREEAAVAKQSADDSKKEVQTLKKHSAKMGKELAVMTRKVQGKAKGSVLGRVTKSRLGNAVGGMMLGGGAGAFVCYLALQKAMAAAT